jgi:arylsulfatase A-like enzyme
VVGLAALSASVALLPPNAKPPAARADAAQAAQPHPNIVFVLTDDLSNNLLPYLPAVQEMQREGTSLSHYYVVDSLCCPSRTAIFTGQYAHNNGVFTNGGEYGGYAAYNANGDESKSFALALQKAGYRTGFMGKYLNGYRPKYPPPPGWDTWAGVGNGYGEFNYNMNIDGRVEYYGHAPQDYLTDVVSQKAGDFIASSASAHQPFMLEVSTFAPHRPYTPAPRYAAAYGDLTYPRTPAFGRLPDNPPRWLTTRSALSAKDDAEVDAQFRQRVRADLAVNDLVEHLRTVLEAQGLADNTYFVFSSDNGYHMGEHRLMPGKQTAFDTDINVPLIVTGPGVPAGRVVDQLASNIDLAPTFETLAGAPVPATVDGVSLTPLLHGRTPQRWQQAVLVEHHHPGVLTAGPDLQPVRAGAPPSYTAVRTLGGLYVRYVDGSQEYYNTTSDPDELHNLAAGGIPPSLQLTLDQLRACHGTQQCQAAALLP